MDTDDGAVEVEGDHFEVVAAERLDYFGCERRRLGLVAVVVGGLGGRCCVWLGWKLGSDGDVMAAIVEIS